MLGLKSKLSNNIELVLTCIDSNYISHFTSNSWGDEILIMEKHGNAFGRVYWYYDDNKNVYLDMLHVSKEVRKQGIGTKLQEIREEIGRKLNAKASCLFVKKDSWMYDWYKRRGYKDCEDRVFTEENVWMEKVL